MLADLWYKNALVYNLDVENYLDADGDGIGDFEGLMRRLDYLESLGVDVLWLAPFQPTPNRDNGYDVADFYGVDPGPSRASRNHRCRSEVWLTTRSTITRMPLLRARCTSSTKSPDEP